ncbi:MAG: hypothetical protein C0467_14630 [Planctomycetaceae bacterium]|nr:hypothetical protein [Planctomycetaceae bacterium]
MPPQVYPGATPPGSPLPPNTLPPVRPTIPLQPNGLPTPANPNVITPGQANPYPLPLQNPIAQPQEVPLPQPENKFSLNARDVTLKRVSGGWQIWGGFKLLRDFGDRENDARNALRVYKDLRPTEWVTIGSPKPIVEYGLIDGRPPTTLMPTKEDPNNPNVVPTGGNSTGPVVTGAGASLVIPIDLRTVRVEAVRGVWCLRDDENIHFNFGPVKADAEQALAVIRRYGFNRIGVVGQPTPVMSYFFVSSDELLPAKVDKGPFARAALQAQIDGLTRVGIPIAGVGFVGEMVRIDPRKLDVRKDGGDWVVASGADVLGRFGPSEWIARDAARTLSDGRFTEFCKVGSAGLTFFLVNGKAPTRVPFTVQGRRFDPTAMKVQQFGGHWAVTDNGRHLFDCVSAEEGETLIRVVKNFGFDQLCHLGPSSKVGVSFLAKGQ